VEERHLSLSEVAERLDKSERTIRRWIKSGKLKAYKPGRDYLIPESAIAELIEGSEVFPKLQAPLPLDLWAAGPEDEHAQRRLLPYVRPWFELWNSLSEGWQAAAESGTLTVGAAQDATKMHEKIMAAMNMVLHQLESEGIDPMTGPIGEGLHESMLRLASAHEAMGIARVQHLEEAPLAQARIGKRKGERPQAEHEEHAKRVAR
jgi:excisionase family DNA binding protein